VTVKEDDMATTSTPATRSGTAPRRRRVYTQLWFWVLVGIGAGILVGLFAPGVGLGVKWIADSFVQMIKVIVGPVIFCTVIIGIASLGNLARAGGLALRALGYFFVATVIITWQSIPFVAFTTFAGLTQVPTEIMEAAELDGSTAFQRFRFITFPYIRPVLLVLLLLQIIWDMRVFPQIKALQTIGGIAAETRTIGVYIYDTSIAGGNLGSGGAIAVILVIVMLALSAYYIRSTLRQDEA
jgi:ABC-type sugar transport system permease subunit